MRVHARPDQPSGARLGRHGSSYGALSPGAQLRYAGAHASNNTSIKLWHR